MSLPLSSCSFPSQDEGGIFSGRVVCAPPPPPTCVYDSSNGVVCAPMPLQCVLLPANPLTEPLRGGVEDLFTYGDDFRHPSYWQMKPHVPPPSDTRSQRDAFLKRVTPEKHSIGYIYSKDPRVGPMSLFVQKTHKKSRYNYFVQAENGVEIEVGTGVPWMHNDNILRLQAFGNTEFVVQLNNNASLFE